MQGNNQWTMNGRCRRWGYKLCTGHGAQSGRMCIETFAFYAGLCGKGSYKFGYAKILQLTKRCDGLENGSWRKTQIADCEGVELT